MKHQIIVIGAGPAGLSAAINAKILRLNVLLVGDTLGSQKTEIAPKVLNYLGIPDVDGKTLNNAFVQHAKQLQMDFLQKKIHGVYKSGKQFMLDAGGDFLYADSVILATGVSSVTSIPNEEKFLGKGVSYCATCDAPLLKDKTACVIGYDEESIVEANYISEICKKVYFLPMKDLKTSLNDTIEVLQNKPVSFEGDTDGRAKTLITDNDKICADGFFVLKPLSASTLAPGLATDGNHVRSDKKGKTNIEGLFVAGDITGAPYKYQKSAGEGLVAAFSAYEYLLGLNKTAQQEANNGAK